MKTREQEMPNPNQLLQNLVIALESAYISSYQTTAAWQRQLDAARLYIDKVNGDL